MRRVAAAAAAVLIETSSAMTTTRAWLWSGRMLLRSALRLQTNLQISPPSSLSASSPSRSQHDSLSSFPHSSCSPAALLLLLAVVIVVVVVATCCCCSRLIAPTRTLLWFRHC